MASETYWERLSIQERSDCIVQGCLLEAWNRQFHPTVLQLIDKNYTEILPRSGVDVTLSFHLCLLGRTQDSADARPTIVILSNERRIARKARRVIRTHDLFLGLNTGFEITFEGRSILHRGGNRCDPVGQAHEDDYKPSLCGALVTVSSHPIEQASTWRQATIGGVVQIGEYFFAVLPAHVFYPEPDVASSEADNNSNSVSSWTENIEEDTNSPIHEPSDSDVDDRDSDDSGYSSHEEQALRSVSRWSDLPPKHGIYLNLTNDQGSHSEKLENIQSATSSGNLTLIGHMDPQCALRPDGSSLIVCQELDYALAKIDDRRFFNENYIITSSGQVVKPNCFRPSHQAPAGKVFIASGVSRIQEVDIRSTASGIFFPWSARPRKVWELNFTLAPGDCGSWVFDLDGSISGIAVATVPSVNITYVIPAAEVFENIISVWAGSIRDVNLFPSKYASAIKTEPEHLAHRFQQPTTKSKNYSAPLVSLPCHSHALGPVTKPHEESHVQPHIRDIINKTYLRATHPPDPGYRPFRSRIGEVLAPVSCVAGMIQIYDAASRILGQIKARRHAHDGPAPTNLLEESVEKSKREIRKLVEDGTKRFGPTFEEGDFTAQVALLMITTATQATFVHVLVQARDHDESLNVDLCIDMSDKGRTDTLIALHELFQRKFEEKMLKKKMISLNQKSLSQEPSSSSLLYQQSPFRGDKQPWTTLKKEDHTSLRSLLHKWSHEKDSVYPKLEASKSDNLPKPSLKVPQQEIRSLSSYQNTSTSIYSHATRSSASSARSNSIFSQPRSSGRSSLSAMSLKSTVPAESVSSFVTDIYPYELDDNPWAK